MKSGLRHLDYDLRHVFRRHHGPHLERLRAQMGHNAVTTRLKVASKEALPPPLNKHTHLLVSR